MRVLAQVFCILGTIAWIGSIPESYYRGLRTQNGTKGGLGGAVGVGFLTICCEDLPQIALGAIYVVAMTEAGYAASNAAIASLAFSVLSTLCLCVITCVDYRSLGQTTERSRGRNAGTRSWGF